DTTHKITNPIRARIDIGTSCGDRTTEETCWPGGTNGRPRRTIGAWTRYTDREGGERDAYCPRACLRRLASTNCLSTRSGRWHSSWQGLHDYGLRRWRGCVARR